MNRLLLVKDESFMKLFLLSEPTYCEQNETAFKRFIKRFYQFNGEKYGLALK